MDSEIGEGTFGKVNLATHIPTGEKVAIKILEKKRIKNQKELNRVEREIKFLKTLNHKNIAQIYEVLECEYNFYLIFVIETLSHKTS